MQKCNDCKQCNRQCICTNVDDFFKVKAKGVKRRSPEWYKPSVPCYVHGIPALKHHDLVESGIYAYQAFGAKGFVYEFSKELIAVTIKGSAKKAIQEINKISTQPKSDLFYKRSEEACFLVPKEYHKEVAKILGIPSEVGRQVRWVV